MAHNFKLGMDAFRHKSFGFDVCFVSFGILSRPRPVSSLPLAPTCDDLSDSTRVAFSSYFLRKYFKCDEMNACYIKASSPTEQRLIHQSEVCFLFKCLLWLFRAFFMAQPCFNFHARVLQVSYFYSLLVPFHKSLKCNKN